MPRDIDILIIGGMLLYTTQIMQCDDNKNKELQEALQHEPFTSEEIVENNQYTKLQKNVKSIANYAMEKDSMNYEVDFTLGNKESYDIISETDNNLYIHVKVNAENDRPKSLEMNIAEALEEIKRDSLVSETKSKYLDFIGASYEYMSGNKPAISRIISLYYDLEKGEFTEGSRTTIGPFTSPSEGDKNKFKDSGIIHLSTTEPIPSDVLKDSEVSGKFEWYIDQVKKYITLINSNN